jgi:hypothetical protein
MLIRHPVRLGAAVFGERRQVPQVIVVVLAAGLLCLADEPTARFGHLVEIDWRPHSMPAPKLASSGPGRSPPPPLRQPSAH